MYKKLIVLSLLLFSISGCSFLNINKEDPNNIGGNNSFSETHVISVKLSQNNLTLNEQETKQLTYTISPSNVLDNTVTWESSNSTIASVDNGLITAWNAGTCLITVTTTDGNKKDSCEVIVNKKQSQSENYVNKTFDFNQQGYSSDSVSLANTIVFDDDFSIDFNIGLGQNNPVCIKYNKVYAARVYAGNTFTISSAKVNLKKIVFAFDKNKDGTNEITTSTGVYNNNTWTGESKEITFTVGGSSGYRGINSFVIYYEGASENPDEVINLGLLSIKEVKQYINDNPVKKNSFGNGVNTNRYVTINGLALAKIDTIKEKASYGLDITYPAKVIVGDETGYIGVATKIGDGTLWNKVGSNTNKIDSKYSITGYISEIQGNPELKIISFQWDKNLDVSCSAELLKEAEIDIESFYNSAKDINYNCAGHGYGKVVKLNGLTAYNIESDGSGVRYYNFTDGLRNLRVNSYNLPNITLNKAYDIIGIISLKNLSAIIVAFDIKESSISNIELNYGDISSEISIGNLKKIKGSQDDTNEKFPAVIECFGNFYKTTGYLCAVEENGKLYIGISDTYYDHAISGKDNARASYNIALIKNDNFWNITYEESALFNPYNDDYLLENNAITVYFTPRQLSYKQNNAMWDILLIPCSINS